MVGGRLLCINEMRMRSAIPLQCYDCYLTCMFHVRYMFAEFNYSY